MEEKKFQLEFVNVRLNHDRTLYTDIEVDSPKNAVKVLRQEMEDYDREHFVILNIDAKGHVLHANVVSIGTLTSSAVDPSQVFKTAILSNASGIIALHNHPSGIPYPSNEDARVTKILSVTGKLLNIELMDHIIVGSNDKYYSFAEEGALDIVSNWSKDFIKKELNGLVKEEKTYNNEKKSFRDKLAEKFIESLEENPKDWVKRWSTNETGRPYNMVSGVKYSGGNALLLKHMEISRNYKDPRWLTFNQVKKLNEKRSKEDQIKIPRGTKMTPIEYYFMYDNFKKKFISWEEYENLSQEEKGQRVNITTGEIVIDKSEKGFIRERYVIRNKEYYVFNAAQLQNMPEYVIEQNMNDIAPSVVVENVAKGMGVEIIEEEQGRAFYSPIDDKVVLPLKSQFESDYDYTSTALHELAHSTGHPSRLNRDQAHGFGSPEYAYEELVAEMTSCFMSEYVESPMSEADMENHVAYVQSWIKSIKNDKNYLFKAIKEANKAADYMIEKGDLIALKEAQIASETVEEKTTEVNEELKPEIRIETADKYIIDENYIDNLLTDHVSEEQKYKADKDYNFIDEIERKELLKNKERLSKEIDAVVNNKLQISESVMVARRTPKILQDVGLNDYPILMTQKHIRNCLHDKGKSARWHGLTKEYLSNLNEYLAHPAIIYDSLSGDDSIVVVTDQVDGDKYPIIVSIKVNGVGQYEFNVISANYLTSTYGHEHLENIIDRAVKGDDVLYVNKEKTRNLEALSKLQLLSRFSKTSGFNTIIHQSSNIVKNGVQKLTNQVNESISYRVAAYPNAYTSEDDVEVLKVFENEDVAREYLKNALQEKENAGKYISMELLDQDSEGDVLSKEEIVGRDLRLSEATVDKKYFIGIIKDIPNSYSYKAVFKSDLDKKEYEIPFNAKSFIHKFKDYVVDDVEDSCVFYRDVKELMKHESIETGKSAEECLFNIYCKDYSNHALGLIERELPEDYEIRNTDKEGISQYFKNEIEYEFKDKFEFANEVWEKACKRAEYDFSGFSCKPVVMPIKNKVNVKNKNYEEEL